MPQRKAVVLNGDMSKQLAAEHSRGVPRLVHNFSVSVTRYRSVDGVVYTSYSMHFLDSRTRQLRTDHLGNEIMRCDHQGCELTEGYVRALEHAQELGWRLDHSLRGAEQASLSQDGAQAD